MFRLILAHWPIVPLAGHENVVRNPSFCYAFWRGLQNSQILFQCNVGSTLFLCKPSVRSSVQQHKEITEFLFKSSKLQIVDFSNRLKLHFKKGFKHMRNPSKVRKFIYTAATAPCQAV